MLEYEEADVMSILIYKYITTSPIAMTWPHAGTDRGHPTATVYRSLNGIMGPQA